MKQLYENHLVPYFVAQMRNPSGVKLGTSCKAAN